MNTATNIMAEQAALKTVGHFIGGVPVSSTANGDQRSQPVYNPATGRVTKRVALASRTTVQAAIAAAEAAYPAWRNTPALKRARVMFKLKQLLEAHADEICALITDEHGKVLSDAMGELQRGIENVEYAAGAPELLKGEFSKNVGPAIDSWSEFQPLGVTAGITPFNFPCMVPLWMWPMAVVCGNTFILKPSERDPSCVLRIAELSVEAGLPPGVLNVVNGDKEAVDTLLTDPRVQAISFVGSTPIAEHIYARGTAAGKRVQALGGAKNHMLVLPDADVAMAADAAISAAYGAAGQRCMAISVVVAVGSVADPLVDAIRERIGRIKVGPGLEKGSEMGPLVTREHRDKVASYLDAAVEDGATVEVDGRKDAATKGDGFFLGASLIDHVAPGTRCYDNEIFGPVLSVVRVKSYPEALKIINENPFGNGTAIFTQNGGAARQFQFDVEVGMVGINVPIPVPVAYYSFGGWKSSLFGDLHMYGPEGVQFYTRSKVVTSRWPDPGTSKVDLGFPQVR